MHVIDFHAVGNGHTCDDNHPHVPCMHTGRKLGKPLPWVGMSLSLVPRREECVRYGMMRHDEW